MLLATELSALSEFVAAKKQEKNESQAQIYSLVI